MVYGGKPSTGCHLCRKRKIKCDEEHPGCRNCAIYGQPCPGYRSDGIFRNETHKVQQLVKKTGSTLPSGKQPNRHDLSTGSSHQRSPLSIYRISDSTWEEKAICYFFDQYTICDETGGVGHLGFIPSLYASCRDQTSSDPASSSLRLAVDATALMALSNRAKAPGIVTQARNRFGLALQRLQEALDLPREAVKDETFATLVILSMFEDISGDRLGLTSSHTAGFEALTVLRGESQLGHARGMDMFKFAYVHMQVEFLLRRGKPTLDPDWIVGRLDSADPLQGLMILASRIAQLLAEPSSALASLESVGVTKLASWIDSCRALDAELDGWSQGLPDMWLPLETRSYTGEDVLTYREMIIAIIWAHFRAVRILVYFTIVDLFRTLASTVNSPGIHREASQYETDGLRLSLDLISETCRSVPFCFGEIDLLGNSIPPSAEGTTRIRAFYVYSTLWPVWYIMSCGLATPEQTQMIRGVMARTGSELGIKLAIMLASYDGQGTMPSMPDLYSFEQTVAGLSAM
ncbi:Zn(II)2Cys6 transcription factor [Aspergillus sclerotioniger CBS 115572]|uniref:Zn(II)2Cys6 transcription factor n=1 Tax=Aspergillus sclerotioniger CBS 115572 TaxID=1450535 RepID=A0A317WSJ8_9EURO|nr:Zn(II)2Cys6 transcription factor [Aspergillus sclerotioniger CBS 115572]PWY89376.1 Zn(II)2Cys6 transcription factor [Aspergillus sclerotioniger CBS 115572]